MFFHPQIDRQTEQINQKLEQFLQFFINYKQKNWPEQLVTAKFVVNNKTYSVAKISLFITNYSGD